MNSTNLLMPNERPYSASKNSTICGPTGGNATTVLLAEDDPAVCAFVCSILQEEGYQVLMAEDSRQSFELCKNYAGIIHMLVTDVVMPGMNGRELAEWARRIRPNLQVLFISGYVDRGLKEEDASNPCFAFLEKPFTANSLLKTLGTLRATARNISLNRLVE